jgi:hypothetical protein
MELKELIFGWQGAVAAEFILTWLVIYLIFMRPRKSGEPRGADSRFYNRYQSKFRGWLLVNGKKRGIRGIDLNNSGALIASREPLAPGDRVFLYLASERLMGWAEVRRCVPRRIFGYNVGVEFRGSLMRATERGWQFQQYNATDLQSN